MVSLLFEKLKNIFNKNYDHDHCMNHRAFLNKYRIDILVIILFLVLPFVFFRDTFRLDSFVLGQGDAIKLYIPFNQLKTDLLKNLEGPFWNSSIFCGFPLLSSPQAAVFYPFHLILLLFGSSVVGYNVSLLLHYSLGGIFMYFLLKEYNLAKYACFLGGVVFIFSGAMISHKSHLPMLSTIIWVPLILLCLEKYRNKKKLPYLLTAAILSAISFFAGHPQIFAYSSIFILLYILYYTFFADKKINWHFLLSVLIFPICFLLILPQLIPSFELMLNSFSRSLTSFNYFNVNSYNPIIGISLFFPFIFGTKNPPVDSGIPHSLRWFGIGDPPEVLIYFGIITIPFIVLSFFKPDRRRYFWFLILCVFFIISMGKYTIISEWLYNIPIYNRFRTPSRNFFIVNIAIAILTGFGFNYYIKSKINKRKRAILVSIFILCFILIVLFLIYNAIRTGSTMLIFTYFSEKIDVNKFIGNISITNYSVYVPLILFLITLIVLVISLFKKNKFMYPVIIFLIFVDLFTMGHFDERSLPNIYKDEPGKTVSMENGSNTYRILPITSYEKENIFLPDRNIYFGYDYTSGYGPLMLRDYALLFNITDVNSLGWIEHTDWKTLLENNNVLSITNTKYIIVPRDLEIHEAKSYGYYNIAYEDQDVLVLENNNYLPRFYFPSEIYNVIDIEEAKNIIWGGNSKWEPDGFDPQKSATVENIDFEKTEFDTVDAKIEVIDYRGNGVILETSSDNELFLVFSDTYYPGWKAYIDNKESKIYKANGMFKGIHIPKGEHNIIFRYFPTGLTIGFAVSIATIISIIVVTFLYHRKRKHK